MLIAANLPIFIDSESLNDMRSTMLQNIPASLALQSPKVIIINKIIQLVFIVSAPQSIADLVVITQAKLGICIANFLGERLN
jgi:hypothetical protein